MKKAIHYINQFFGQIGGEDKADFPPTIKEGLIGPAQGLNQLLKEVEITHTIICGDNFMGSREEEAVSMIIDFLKDKEFDLFFAGPAFLAGRYGNACGRICKEVNEKFGVPVITSMNVENPAVNMFRQDVYIFEGGNSARKMKEDLQKMAAFGDKIARGDELLPAKEEGYFPRGIRFQTWMEPPIKSADRAVDMLLKKLNGEPYETELPIPKSELVPIAPAIKDLSSATIALVSSGGIVPSDNPDRIQSASATKWGKYDISKLDAFPSGEYKTIHAGYDPAAANEDPNRVVPLDALRQYEKEGKIGKVHDYFYTTVGTGTTQGEAARMGREIAEELVAAGVDGVILTST
jgi:glycine/betaine/sarcosine/D-proline reductase family selenoprotein B